MSIDYDMPTMTDRPGPPIDLDSPPLIYSRLAQVMADIGAISKAQSNDFHGYKFRGIDDVMNHLHGPLSRHGVVILPEVVDAEYEWKADRKGNPIRVATLRTAFHFVAPDGSRVTAVGVGEANATDDKATNKAMSAAFKYVMLQVFCIPTEDMGDADRTSPDVGQAPQLSDELWDGLKAAGGRLKMGAGDDFDQVRQSLLDKCGIDHLTRDTPLPQAEAMLAQINGWLEENTEPFDVPGKVVEQYQHRPTEDVPLPRDPLSDRDPAGMTKQELIAELHLLGESTKGNKDELVARVVEARAKAGA